MLAAWLIALAVLMKVAVPAGYMPVVADGRVTLAICTGMAPPKAPIVHSGTHMAAHAMPQDHAGHEAPEVPRHDMPCAFAGLSAPAVAAADVLMLAAAIAFVIASGLVRQVAPCTAPRRHVRPPLRGPPIFA
jgi:hypothetical protein